MTTIKYGASCDGDGCGVAFNDYDTGDVVYCPVCERDLCPLCAKATGHEQTREADVDTVPALSCDPDDKEEFLSSLPDDYIDSPADGWSMKEAR